MNRQTWIAIAVVAFCAYAPFSWLLADHIDSYRLRWLLMWPVLPRFVPGFLFHPNDVAERATMGVVTVVLLPGLVWLGRRSKTRLLVAAALALAARFRRLGSRTPFSGRERHLPEWLARGGIGAGPARCGSSQPREA